MKSIKNIYSKVCAAGLLTLCTTSCQDWLTVYPQDRVVEENFWEDKNDLEGVRYGAYRQMASTVLKLAVWGDLRSDSYQINRKENSAQGNRDDYIDIMNGQPDSSMSIFDWGGVYKTINLCNKVLSHGDEILAKDKQFTSSEWIQMRAEMTALRALNYFYLIRAFKDVPYTTRVINSDAEVVSDTLMPQLQVLDSIITDCERVKGQARNRFSSTSDSKGMITNSAIYAMLADMCLWRASLHEGRHAKAVTYDILYKDGVRGPHTYKEDYEMSALYADTCLQLLAKQTEDSQVGAGMDFKTTETQNYGLENCNMIKNDFTGANQSVVPGLEAMQAIFNTGNSVESIFELQFSVSDGLSNSMVNSLYGYNDGTHLEVCKEALDAIYEGGVAGEDDNNGGKWDSRLWICCQNLIAEGSNNGAVSAQPAYYCLKYEMPTNNVLNMTTESEGQKIQSVHYASTSYHHWIIYRMTDVMLIKAEALAHSGAAAATNKKTVVALCNAIHRRSYCNYKNGTTPATDIATTSGAGNTAKSSESDLDKWVLNERQVELLGEGKRWFDLVRYAERNSYVTSDPVDTLDSNVPNGYTGMKTMIDDYLSNAYQTYATTLKNRFKNRWGLYCPIYYMDVKASDYKIRQNPVWNKSKYEQ